MKSYNEKVFPVKRYLKKNRRIFKDLQKNEKTIVAGFIKREKKTFFNSLNSSFVNDNKFFWKTIKSFFSRKNNNDKNIKLQPRS